MSFTPISSDPIADAAGLQTVAVGKSSSSTFDSVLSGLSAAAYYSGDTVNAFTTTYGSDTVASISALTSNAVYDGAGTAAALSTSTTGSYGSTGSSAYLTGGYSSSSLGSSSSYLTGSSDIDSLSAMADQTPVDMASLMALQMKLGQETVYFTTATNIEKNRTDSLKSAAANMK